MTNKQAYAGLLERLQLHRTWRDGHGELNDAPNEAAEAISSLLKRVGELETVLTGWSNAMRLSGVWPVKDANDPFQALLFDTHAALNSDAPLSIGEEQ